MKEIREWLESKGRDYAQGLALYAAHGRSSVVLKVLQRGASEFTRQKLKQELGKLAESPTPTPAIATPPVKKAPVRPPVAAAPPANPHEPPAADPQRRAWFAERNHLHPQLEACATDAERLAMSLRILELGQLIEQSYAAEADVASPAPTASLAHVDDAGEIRRLLANLRPQRTKLKKRSDRAADLLQVEADIKTLETKLQASHV